MRAVPLRWTASGPQEDLLRPTAFLSKQSVEPFPASIPSSVEEPPPFTFVARSFSATCLPETFRLMYTVSQRSGLLSVPFCYRNALPAYRVASA